MAVKEARSSGYDLQWLKEPPDDLKCLICLCVAKDPQQHPGEAANHCGKIFCRDCITDYQDNYTKCPNCRQKLTLFQDSRSARVISALHIKCNNQSASCPWTGELGSLQDHLKSCAYEPVSCKYAPFGCKETPLRKDLVVHEENDSLHLRVTKDKILELSKLTDAFSHVLKSTTQTPCTFKLTNYEQCKKANKAFFSQPFYTSYSGYKMCLEVHANGNGAGKDTHISMYAHLMKGEHDEILTWPFTGSVIIELLNQLEDKNHDMGTFTFRADKKASQKVVNGELGPGGGTPKFISHLALHYNAKTKTQYLQNDTLVFRIKVKIPNYKQWLECTM